ncbi:MAG TPA: PEP-CTERM sorting domain-containing protein [Casimicrobiaceae bacterium]|nr:PEP-CTERM sorting domain-containing protein [Casimicrobiaceae bacterium]
MRPIRHALALLATVLAANVHAAIVINLPNFSNCATLQLNGNAACLSNVLRVTPATFNQSGSAFSQTSIPLGPGNTFSTFFSFNINTPGGIGDGDGPGADGITFTVQPNASTAGGAGGGIGYAGIANSIAIEFDTFNNGPGGGDPNGNHLGVDINGSVFSVATVPVAARMNDGSTFFAWVDYNGSVLEVRLSQTNVRPAAPTLSHTVNLATVIGQNQAFVGFTSGTGSGFGNHDIQSWVFDNTFNPIGGPPPPAVAADIPALSVVGLLLSALALGALGIRSLRRRG